MGRSGFRPDWTPDWLDRKGIAHSDLRVGDKQGFFDGTIKIENYEDLHVDVYVTVNLYDGDQEVGDLSGSVTLKPNSGSTVDLDSSDRFVSYDNTTVELLPIPGQQPG